MADNDGQSRSYACFAALQALFIVLVERGHIEGDDIREALEEAADAARAQAAEGAGVVHREAALLLEDLLRDTYASRQNLRLDRNTS